MNKYIERLQAAPIREFIADKTPHKDVFLVEGARQVGKTTLIEHVLAASKTDAVRLNLEKHAVLRKKIDACREFSEFEDLLEDELGYRPRKNSVLFIDESQESIQLGKFVRFMKESWEHATVILTGSTLTRLFRKDTRYPVGRVKRITITPFAFTEYLKALRGRRGFSDSLTQTLRAFDQPISSVRHLSLMEQYDRYLDVGGLPQVVLDFVQGADYRKRLESILADYEQDFIRLFGEDSIGLVNACLKSVAHFAGSPSKNTTVVPSPTTPVNHKINEVFARLEEWKLILRSAPKSVSPEKSYAYLPKRYLFDTGLLKFLREGATPSLRVLETAAPDLRAALGGIIENQVAIEIARGGSELAGWKKTSSGGEIDFVIRKNNRAYPLECKTALKIKGTHLRGILDYLQLYDLKTGFLISGAPFQIIPCEGKRRIVNLPLYAAEKIGEAVARYI